jgi:hypothetical protein
MSRKLARLCVNIVAFAAALVFYLTTPSSAVAQCDLGTAPPPCPDQATMDALCQMHCGADTGDCQEYGGFVIYLCGEN